MCHRLARKSVLLVVLLITSIPASTLLAGDPTEPTCARSAQPGEAAANVARLSDAPARLFFAVPADAVPRATANELRLHISVDGELFVDNVLGLAEDPRGATFELLAGDQARRRKLADFARTARVSEVRLSLGDRVVRTLTLPEFLAYGKEVQTSSPEVTRPASDNRTFGVVAGRRSENKPTETRKVASNTDCYTNCDINKQYCYQNNPCGETTIYCEICENEYNQCINYCLCVEDSDGDGIGNCSDNCAGTPNSNQTDCDGDGAGNACDDFNGNTVELGEQILFEVGRIRIDSWCWGGWLYEWWAVLYLTQVSYVNVYCDGTPPYYFNEYGTGWGSELTVEYAPWDCYEYITDPGDESSVTSPDAPFASAAELGNNHELIVRDGRLALRSPEGERVVTVPSFGELRVEQHGEDLVLVGPYGKHFLDLKLKKVIRKD